VLTHGAVRCGSAFFKAPAVLHGFSWLDDTQLVCASDESSWPNESEDPHFIVAEGPARMAILDDSEEEGLDLQQPSEITQGVVRGASEDCRKSVVAGVVLAICAAMEPDVRAFSDSGMSRRLVQAGAVLLKAGDAAPGFFYVVISGRVRCTEPRRDAENGSWRTWRGHREVVRGGTVGLSAALSGAAVLREDAICVRDTELVAVPNPVLLDGAGDDQARNGVWLRQLRASLLSEKEEHHEEVSTIAVFGVDAAGAAAASHLAPRLAHALRTVVDEGHVLRVRRKDFLRKKNEPATTRRRRVSAWSVALLTLRGARRIDGRRAWALELGR
jgi:CRP-like cAMP-binding protein